MPPAPYNPDDEGENAEYWKDHAKPEPKSPEEWGKQFEASAQESPKPPKSEGLHPTELLEQIAKRFADIGFDPETIHDPDMFSMLFFANCNCLMVKRAFNADNTAYVTGHWFLAPKTK